jgi:hypothetical protein
VALTGESEEALESARCHREAATGQMTGDRGDPDYFRLFVSRFMVVGVSLADLRFRACLSSPSCVRQDADLPRSELGWSSATASGYRPSRVSDAARILATHRGTTEFSYVRPGRHGSACYWHSRSRSPDQCPPTRCRGWAARGESSGGWANRRLGLDMRWPISSCKILASTLFRAKSA